MRVNRIALAIAMCAGVALFAARAQAGTTSDLAEGFYDIADDPNNAALNNCFVGSDFGFFETGGTVTGAGTGGQAISIDYDTPQPTNVSHSSKKIAVKQSTFSTIRIIGGAGGAGTFNTGFIPVTKCSVNGSVNVSKLTGSVGTDCNGSDLFSVLTADQAASVQTAFANNKRVKFKYNANNGKASLTIHCKGDAVLEAP